MQTNKAIPTNRSYPLRMPKGWEPPVPAWSSTFVDTQTSVSMALVGFQHPAGMDVMPHMAELQAALESAEICDLLTSDAGGGLHETTCIAYWRNQDAAKATMSSGAYTAFWKKHIDADGYGVIKECANIPFNRTETLFSGPVYGHGYSQMREGIVGPIPHHQYWGGMRDRIPLSAHDALEANGSSVCVVEQSGNHVVVEAHENLCIIRSGQDWSNCDDEQLSEYIDTIEPTLKAGMAFLRDQGDEVNCYSCRYMKDIALDGSNLRRSCGIAYFRTMRDLENWSEHHPTHLEIFNTFLSIAPRYGPNLQLQLWHEVSVLPATDCSAEYVNCRPGTGWMPT